MSNKPNKTLSLQPVFFSLLPFAMEILSFFVRGKIEFFCVRDASFQGSAGAEEGGKIPSNPSRKIFRTLVRSSIRSLVKKEISFVMENQKGEEKRGKKIRSSVARRSSHFHRRSIIWVCVLKNGKSPSQTFCFDFFKVDAILWKICSIVQSARVGF